MAEEDKVVNQTQEVQKDFTKKNKYDKKVDKDVKEEKKIEKADLNFNSSASTTFDSTIKKVTVPESKPVTVQVESKPVTATVSNTVKATVNGKVISVSNLSYIVKTKDGNGVLVTGKHNKKLGDTV